VIGDDQEQGVLPVVRCPGLLEELADGVVRVLGGVVAGLLGLLVQGDAVVGELEGIVVAGAEHQAEEGFALLVQRREGLVGLGHQIFIRGAPGSLEHRVLEVLLLDDGGEAVAEEEAAHVVEVALATIDEAGVIASLLEQVGDGEEVGLALAELDHGLGRGRREAGEHRLDAAYRTGTGGVELLERPTLFRQGIDVRGERQAAEGADELGPQALLQQDHQVFGLALVAGRVEGLAWQIGRGEIAERATALLADYVEYLMVSHLAVKLAGVLLGPHLLDGKEQE
jgi:hypothetical protein